MQLLERATFSRASTSIRSGSLVICHFHPGAGENPVPANPRGYNRLSRGTIMNLPEETAVLSSWKDIAKYMGKGVRTVQRWEHHLGLPVRRPNGASHKSAVLVDRSDLEAWMATRFSARGSAKDLPATRTGASELTRKDLKESIRRARALRDANYELTQEIAKSIRLLSQRCDRLSDRALEVPWSLAVPAPPEAPVNQLARQSKRIA
jgi:hypothetical protein